MPALTKVIDRLLTMWGGNQKNRYGVDWILMNELKYLDAERYNEINQLYYQKFNFTIGAPSWTY